MKEDRNELGLPRFLPRPSPLGLLALLLCAATATAQQTPLYQEIYRPQFHFTSQTNWLNDPNGLVYCDGNYELFFQHNPSGIDWGNMTWGHATCTDLLHWQQVGDAISPDANGTIFSGSAVIDANNTAGFGANALVCMFTYSGSTYTQGLAYSTDNGQTFTKYPTPVISEYASGNRDPRAFWYAPANQWRMALYLSGDNFAIFGSPDLKTWTQRSTLTFSGGAECPDMYEIPLDGNPADTRWVFSQANGKYEVGTFDGTTFTPQTGVLQYEYGANSYAGQTYNSEPLGRRISLTWMNGGSYPNMPFNQQMSIPTELTLQTTSSGARLFSMPAAEVASLRTDGHHWSSQTLNPGDNPLSDLYGRLFDVDLQVAVGSATGIDLTLGGNTIHYNTSTHVLSALGQTATVDPVSGQLSLRVLSDVTSVEIFANNGAVRMSSCFVPGQNNQALSFSCQGGTASVGHLDVYGMSSVWFSSPGVRYWDCNGTAAGAGGPTPTGTWGSDAAWNTAADGTAATAAWSQNAVASFAGGSDATGSYTVTVTGTQQIAGLVFTSGAVTLSGGVIDLVSDNTTVTTESGTHTIQSAILGWGNLVKSGSGTLVFTGSNTYTGMTRVSAGTLVAASPGAMGASTAPVVLGSSASQGTLVYSGTSTAWSRGLVIGNTAGGRLETAAPGQTLVLGGAGIIGVGPLTVGGAGNTTLASPVTTTGGLIKQDSGTLLVTAGNTYTGPTIVAGGTLKLPGAAGGVPAGTVAYYSFDNPGALGTDGGPNGNTLKVTGGTWQYSASGKFGGALYLDGATTLGTLSGAFPVGVPTGRGAYTVAALIKPATDCPAGGGWIGYGANSQDQTNNFRLNGSNGVWNYWWNDDLGATMASGNFYDGNWHSVVGTYDGTTQIIYIDGVNCAQRTATALNVQATQFLIGKTVNDVNFKGSLDDLLIANRALSATEVANLANTGLSPSNNPLPTTTALMVSGGATFDLSGGSQQVAALSDYGGSGGTIALGAGKLTINNSSANSLTGTISGAGGSIVKQGAGTLALAGSNTYTGGTTVSAGTLQLGHDHALGSGGLTVNAGAVDLNTHSISVASLAGAGGTISDQSGTAGITTLTVNQTASTTFGGAIQNGANGRAVGLTLGGPGGMLTLTATQSYSGPTVISGGTLKLQGASFLPAAGNVLWLDASDSSKLVLDGAGRVSQWTDKSGLLGGSGAGTVTQSTSANRPLAGVDSLGGKNVLRFTGTNGARLTGSQVLTAGDDSYSYFVVWKSSLNNVADIFETGTAASNQRAALLVNGSGRYGFVGEGNDWKNMSYSYNNWYTTALEINDASPYLDSTNNVRVTQYKSGTALSTSAGTTNAKGSLTLGTGGIAVGSNQSSTPGEYFTGDIAEILVYDSILAAADKQAVLNYLNYKWFGVGSPPGSSNVLPVSTAVSLTGTGAVLDLSGVNQQIGSLSGVPGSEVKLGGAVLKTGADNQPSTFAGQISGSGSLVKQGSGQLTLAGTNLYTGGTTVSAGVLEVADADALPAGRTLTIGAGGGVMLTSGLGHAISLGGLTITSGADGGSDRWSVVSGQSLAASPGDASAPTPEPGTVGLLLAAVVGVLAFRSTRFSGSEYACFAAPAKACTTKRGFTLVELLVVITIIGILVALLLPAVQAARESGRRTQCANNLRQMALACLSHEEARGALPDGGETFWTSRSWSATGMPAVSPNQNLGWAYQILPYIEGQNAWVSGSTAEDVGKILLPWCNCPTKRRPMVLIDDQSGGSKTRGGMDYAGNGGCESSLGQWGMWGNGSDAPICRRPIAGDSTRPHVVSAADLTDGATNTLLLGEKCLNIGAFPYNQADDDGGWIEGWDFDTIRWGCFQPMPDWSSGPVMPISAIRHDYNSHGGRRYAFGSSHPGVFNGAMCDGSVRQFTYSVSLDVFKNLCSRNDGQTIDFSKL